MLGTNSDFTDSMVKNNQKKKKKDPSWLIKVTGENNWVFFLGLEIEWITFRSLA